MLEFLHPHIETQVYDNSFTYEEAAGGGTALFQPYFSDKGQDNLLEKFTSLTTFQSQKGFPNFKKHGQSIYNATNWLGGQGVVYGVRLMPDDSFYSNFVINVMTRANADGTMVAKVSCETIGNISDKTLFASIVEARPKTISEPDPTDITKTLTWTSHYIQGFMPKGRGIYGNNYSIKLSLNNSYRNTYDFRCYNLNIVETDNSGNSKVIEGPFLVSLYPEAVDNTGASMFINNVLKDYSAYIDGAFDEDQYTALITALNAADNTLTDATTDFIFCNDTNFVNYTKLSLDSRSAKLDQFIGIQLDCGSDGSLTMGSPARPATMTKLLSNCFLGTIDDSIMNKKANPFDVCLDANYDVTVKTQMQTFCEVSRGDVFPYFDSGFLAKSSDVLSWRKNSFDLSTYVGSLMGQTFKVNDTYTGQSIPVTYTYFLASKIPAHDSKFGCQYPIAGPNYGLVSGFVDGTMNFNPDDYQQEDLYTAQINYILQDDEDTEIGSQLTLQKRNSALSNANNVRVLFKLVRQIEKRAKYYKFEFGDNITIAAFQGDLNGIPSEWINNRAFESLKLTVYQTPYDKTNKTCRVKVDGVFNGIIERIAIEVNIGK